MQTRLVFPYADLYIMYAMVDNELTKKPIRKGNANRKSKLARHHIYILGMHKSFSTCTSPSYINFTIHYN